MSGKKVKKAIREQRRQRRRAEREQARLEKLNAEETPQKNEPELPQPVLQKKTQQKTETEKPAPAPAVPPATRRSRAAERHAAGRHAAHGHADDAAASESGDASASPRRRGGLIRVGAVAVTAGVVAVGGGSAVADLSGADSAPLAPVAGSGVPSPQTGESYLCPPMPGQADSITTDGILDYAPRDGSAGSVFQSLVIAADGAELPQAEVAQLSEEDRLNSQPVSGQDGVIHHQETDQERPPLLEVSAAPEGSPLTAGGLYEYYADEGPVTGLAVGECVPAEQSRWFFGPETGPGASSLLTLSNPYDRASTVEITTYDAEGERGASGSRSIVVPPQTVRTVNLAALTGGTANLGVDVAAAGAPVAAQLQSSRAAGLTGVGTEFLPGSGGAAEEHHIPAIPMPDTTEAEDEDTLPAELWIHVPGQEGATVELQVFGEDGQLALESPSVFTVEGGRVDALELLGPEAGVYDVVVRTDRPSYAAVGSRGMGEGAELDAEDEAAAEEAAEEEGEELESTLALDFSWGIGAQPLDPGSGAILPEIGRTEEAETALHLFSPQGGSLTYQLVGQDGELSEPQQAEVPADRSLVISAEELEEVMEDAVAVVVEDSDAAVHASLLTTHEDGRFSISQVGPLREAEVTVPVRIRD